MPNVNTRLSIEDRDRLKKTLKKALSNRVALAPIPDRWQRLANDSPDGAYEIFWEMLPTDIRSAIDTLLKAYGGKFDGMFETNRWTRIGFSGAGEININWGKSLPVIATWTSPALVLKEKHPMHAEAAEFIAKRQAVWEEGNDARKLAEHVIDTCNTFGQINRVWPDLLNTISSEKVAPAQSQQRQSRLPDSLDYDWIVRQRGKATELIAQGMILPTVDSPVNVIGAF